MLSEAAAALQRNDPEAAVAPLLAVWRAVADPRVADLLDAVSARTSRPALQASTQKKLNEEFERLVAEGDPLDQPRLGAVIGTTRSQPMVQQLDCLLERWPADPRFSRPLVQLLRRPPFIGAATQSAWRRLFKLLQGYGDARVIGLLGALDFGELLRQEGGIENRENSVAFFEERSTAVVRALEKKYAKGIPKLPERDEALLARLFELARPKSETELVAEVLDRPRESAVKAVLADHLLDQNDVRGRFMVLQRARAEGSLTPALIAEERALVAAHGKQWIGDLAALVDTDTMQFEDGFLSSCGIESDRHGVVQELTGHPAWSTVRRVFIAGNTFPHALLTHPAMKSLTSVTGIRTGLAVLTGPDVYPWSEVGIIVRDGPREGSVELMEAGLRRVFPEARELVLDAYEIPPTRYGFLWSGEFAQLTSIGFVAASRSALRPWVEELLERAPKGAAIELSEFHHLGYLFRLDGARKVLDLRCRAAWGRRTASYLDLASAAAPLAGTLEKIRLHDRATKAERATLEKLLTAGGTVEPVP
ncbi:MAG: hypothetical protein ACXVEE_36050 [Polyangiales bacterium]